MGSPFPVPSAARRANSTAFALQGFFFAVVLTQLPQLKDHYGMTDSLIVGAVVLVSVLAGVGSLLAERLATRLSSRVALRIGLGLITITGAITAFAPNIPVLLAALACYGVAVGIVDATTNMQAVFIQHGYGRFILSSFYAAWSSGSILGALYVSGCEALGVASRESLLGAATLVLILGLVAGPRLLGRDEAESGATEQHSPTDSIALRGYLGFGVTIALVFAIDLSVGNWSGLYLREDLLAGSATAALALAAYQGASLLARLSGDWWVRRFGPRRVVWVAAAVGAVGLAVVVGAADPVMAFLGFLIAGLGMPVIAPLGFSEAGRLAHGSALDALIARLNLFNYAGTLFGGGVVGGIAAGFGHRAGFVIPLVFAVALIVLARIFPPRAEADNPRTADPGRAVLDK
ncbi:MFS transporter [Nocardia panacis]|uniref:MFS transporter n=1 Tax=Nocardia panacis TaxID=2340916 RepID=A0A3A4KJ44_9NOCA|nr:MFS transporter [Nocardia panacis]RJO72946.1 MFS transporter [Nocardia panacis]